MAKGRRARRHRVTIQSPVRTTGDYGNGKIVSWDDQLVNIPADFEHTGGTEVLRGEQVQAEVVGIFKIRKHPIPVLTTYQLLHLNDGGKAYGIVSARPKPGPADSADRDIWIYVKAIADGD